MLNCMVRGDSQSIERNSQCQIIAGTIKANLRGITSRRGNRNETKGEKMKNWTNQEICDYFDNHPNMLIRELARITGKSVPELLIILMETE